MKNLTNLCEQFNKIANDFAVELSLKDKNPELFEVLSKARFLSKELLSIKNIQSNEKEFAYLINEVIQTLPLILTYAKNTITVGKSMFMDYKFLRDHISSLLDQYMAYNKMYIDSEGDEKELQALHVNFWNLCFELKEFLDKVVIFVNAA